MIQFGLVTLNNSSVNNTTTAVVTVASIENDKTQNTFAVTHLPLKRDTPFHTTCTHHAHIMRTSCHTSAQQPSCTHHLPHLRPRQVPSPGRSPGRRHPDTPCRQLGVSAVRTVCAFSQQQFSAPSQQGASNDDICIPTRHYHLTPSAIARMLTDVATKCPALGRRG